MARRSSSNLFREVSHVAGGPNIVRQPSWVSGAGRFLALATLLVVLSAPAWSQAANEVPLRSGRRVLSGETTDQFLGRVRASRTGLHGLALLRRPPSQADRQRLAEGGLTLLNRLTRNAYLV